LKLDAGPSRDPKERQDKVMMMREEFLWQHRQGRTEGPLPPRTITGPKGETGHCLLPLNREVMKAGDEAKTWLIIRWSLLSYPWNGYTWVDTPPGSSYPGM